MFCIKKVDINNLISKILYSLQKLGFGTGGEMFPIAQLGQMCECGRGMPTCREVYHEDIELWDNYCESCYVWYCWWNGKEYIPYNDTMGWKIRNEKEVEELEAYIFKLYAEGKFDFPKYGIVRKNDRPVQILNIIKTNPGITANELSDHLGYRGKGSLYRHILPLVDKGKIRFEKTKGGGKGRYYLTEDE